MRSVRLCAIVICFAAALTSVSYAGKGNGKGGGNGGGGGDDGSGSGDPPAPPFQYTVEFIGQGVAEDINNHGEVVGWTFDAKGFFWTAETGRMDMDSVLPEIPGLSLSGSSINDNGDIVGWTVAAGSTSWDQGWGAFRYDGTTDAIMELDDSFNADPVINELGQVAYESSTVEAVNICYSDGTYASVTAPGIVMIGGISDTGYVSVNYEAGCYRMELSTGIIEDFPNIRAGLGDMNSFGIFAGTGIKVKGKAPYSEKAVRVTAQDDITIAADSRAAGFAINNLGDISGHRYTTRWTPFIYTEQYGHLDVGTMITGDTTLWDAANHLRIYGMNDHRQLCGRASFWDATSGRILYEAFVLTPVPTGN